MRKFHIDQFPRDRIFVKLNKEFHNRLFSRIKEYKFKEFNTLFFNNRLNYSTFKNWKRRTINIKNRKKKAFIPLWFILRLNNIFPELTINEFEKNIIAYKGPSTSSVIANPNLPLIENSRLMKVLSHLLGDGCVSGAFGTKLPKGKSHSEYRNFDKVLLDSFAKDLKVFGNIKVSINYEHGHVIVPNVVGYILKEIYQIKFDCFNSRIPKSMFKLSKKLIAPFLRAFGDDEGHVYDSSIEYYSNNKYLLSDILTLIRTKFPEISVSILKENKKAGKNIKYYFTIFNSSQQIYLNKIGFDSVKKTEDLKFNISRKNKWNPALAHSREDPCSNILRILKNEKLSAKKISRKLIIRHSAALHYLNKLKLEGKVDISKKEGWSNIWKLI